MSQTQTLDQLKARIADRHTQIQTHQRNAIEPAIDLGEALADVKTLTGNLPAWVAAHCPFDMPQARKYLRVYGGREAIRAKMADPVVGPTITSIDTALAAIRSKATPKPKTPITTIPTPTPEQRAAVSAWLDHFGDVLASPPVVRKVIGEAFKAAGVSLERLAKLKLPAAPQPAPTATTQTETIPPPTVQTQTAGQTVKPSAKLPPLIHTPTPEPTAPRKRSPKAKRTGGLTATT